MAWLEIILEVAGAIYLGAPMLIRATNRMAAVPRILFVEPQDLPPDVGDFLLPAERELAAEGFEFMARVRLPDSAPNLESFLSLLAHPDKRDKCMLVVICTDAMGSWKIATQYVEFNTRYSGGRDFNTMNSPTLPSFPPAPTTTTTQLPSVQAPVELYRIHQFVLERAATPGTKLLYEKDKVRDYIRDRVILDTFKAQVQAGYFYLDQKRQAYRPTLKGAFLMTWGLLPPVLQLRQQLLRRKERAFLSEFEAARR